MANLLATIRKFRHYITNQIWNIRLDKVNKRQSFLIRLLRVLSLSMKGFRDDNCLISATALTFYTVFSIVPIVALMFAIAKGVGMDKDLEKEIMGIANDPQYGLVVKNALNSANNMLSTARGGVIAGFGIVLLLWSVMSLLINIENSFNRIWEIKRGRSWVRKLTDYLTIILIGPVFVIISGGLTVSLQAKIGNMHHMGFLSVFLFKLLAYAMVVAVFTLLYVVLPNTRVKFKSAFYAGIIATFLFELLSWGYVKFQIGASRMNAIYGGFAALPLFLIWLQYCWYIVLFGAEIAFASQNVMHYEFEEDIKNLSARYKKVISLMIANLVCKRFSNGQKPLSASLIAIQLDLPLRLARNLINEFVEIGIFVEVKTDNDKDIVYQPGMPENKLTVRFLFDTIDRKGVNSLPIEDTQELVNINKMMHELDKTMDNDMGNMLIKDIVK